MANITYYLGAGASYQAIPIQNALGHKMMELYNYILRSEEGHKDRFIFPNVSGQKRDLKRALLHDIGYFGQKALEYGSIDTYAKKLWFNPSAYGEEPFLIKLAVNFFFSIWQNIDQEEWRKMPGDNTIKYRKVDSRYTALLAAILKKGNDGPYLPDNINFITWNYDLQLEGAFTQFLPNFDWDLTEKVLSFLPIPGGRNLQICHLNGLSGYYLIHKVNKDAKYHRLSNRNDAKEFSEFIENLVRFRESYAHGDIDLDGMIGYAWEDELDERNLGNDYTIKAKVDAIPMMQKADVLVIIGYSFPPFNRATDRMLFKNLGEECRIVYQCPGAKKEIFKSLLSDRFNPDNIEIVEELDKFYLPDDFFSGSSE